MPVTRSITRARAATTSPVVNVKRAPKRQLESSDPVVPTKRNRTSHGKAKAKKSETEGTVPRPLVEPSGEELAPLPAKLIFSLEDAKNHLIQADHRFRDVFCRLPCKPFETLEGVHPFRSVSSWSRGDWLYLTMWTQIQNLVHFHNVSGDTSMMSVMDLSRTLNQACSGQQISWLAARAILHKFLKLYFPELPDKPDDQ
jgi:DNA-3-methyladenine glycosylase II